MQRHRGARSSLIGVESVGPVSQRPLRVAAYHSGFVSPSSMAGVNFSAPSAKRPQQITTCAHALRSRLAATFAASVRRHRRTAGMST